VDVIEPRRVKALQGKSIKYLGKTAEVGSCAFSFSGKKFYLWGARAPHRKFTEVSVSQLSKAQNDHVVHISCGHDSGFLIVMASGAVYSRVWAISDFVCLSKYVIDHHLEPNEKPIWSIGSQAGMSGVVTNKHRVIAWRVDHGNNAITHAYQKETEFRNKCTEDISLENFSLSLEDPSTKCFCFIVPPVDAESGETFVVTKAAFGHRNWFAIGPTRRLYWIQLSKFPGWGWTAKSGEFSQELKLWQPVPETEHLKIIDVDGGTNHSGFVTDDGDVYTWGDGSHGCLGHGNMDNSLTPKRVEFFKEAGMKAVSIGCGGYVSWSGGFTIVLLDDNRLFYFGKLGSHTYQTTPKQVVVPDRLILSISAGEDWAGIVTNGKVETE